MSTKTKYTLDAKTLRFVERLYNQTLMFSERKSLVEMCCIIGSYAGSTLHALAVGAGANPQEYIKDFIKTLKSTTDEIYAKEKKS